MPKVKRKRRTKLEKFEEQVKELSIKEKIDLIEIIKKAAQEEHRRNKEILGIN